MAVILLAALVIRITSLEARPVHTDEAVHAVVLGEMLEGGLYRYNPWDCHGPALYFLAWPVLSGLGATNLATLEAWQLRAITVGIGLANILALSLFARHLGRGAVLWAAVLMAGAAPLVYYDRYFIHESLFLFFTLLILAVMLTGIELLTTSAAPGPSATRAWLCVIGIGAVPALLLATKETAVITFAACVPAAAVALLHPGPGWSSLRDALLLPANRGRVLVTLAGAGLVFSLVLVAFYTSFGAHWQGIVDSARAVPRFANRAAGEGHEKPWWIYMAWLLWPNRFSLPWSGWMIAGFALVAVAFTSARATASLAFPSTVAVRFIAVFSLCNALVYSTIPYKTPWLVVTMLGPLCLVAGSGLAFIMQALRGVRPGPVASAAIPMASLVLICSALLRETCKLCYQDPADDRNPYAYSPTVPDIERLEKRVSAISSATVSTSSSEPPSPSPSSPVFAIYVVGADYWPLPWYLRHHSNVGYWARMPDQSHPLPTIIIASTDALESVQQRLGPDWKALPFGLRPGVLVFLFQKNEDGQAGRREAASPAHQNVRYDHLSQTLQ